MKMKKLGIIGGLGPETSCKFCLNINNKFRTETNCQPDIVLENLPISNTAERKIINGSLGKEHFKLLMNAVKRLNNHSVDFIVIPCNTVHVFIEKLRKTSNQPILSIIEESVKECKRRKFKKVALLASAKTVNEKLHENELEKENIKLVLPSKEDQKEISKIIIRIIHNKTTNKDKQVLSNIINKFKIDGAEAVILGCTDLPFLIKESCLPLVDSLEVLENAVVKKLREKKDKKKN